MTMEEMKKEIIRMVEAQDREDILEYILVLQRDIMEGGYLSPAPAGVE